MSADVIARVRALAADFESRGDFATASDLLALCTTYAQVTAERDELKNGAPCYCPKCGSCGEVGCCGMKCYYLPEHTESLKWYEDEIARVTAERDAAKEAFDNLSTLQQADRKELLDTRGQLATLRADLAAQVEGMLADVPDRHSGTRREDFIRTRNRTLHRVIRILRGPHAD